MTKTFDTGVEIIGPIHLMHGGSLVFNGNKQGQEKLKYYNFDTGTEISCVDIPYTPCGSCLLELGGRQCLALTDG